MMEKVTVVGATGAVGQQLFIDLLASKRFLPHQLLASSQPGRTLLREVRPWVASDPLPLEWGEIPLETLDVPLRSKMLFVALPEHISARYEKMWVDQGHIVWSASAAHRMDPDIPLMVADVQQELTPWLEKARRGHGVLVCKPNCVVAILSTFLAPLLILQPKKIDLVSLQSLSGAGFPGLSAWQMCSDLLPTIEGEASKIEAELPKLFGASWSNLNCSFSATSLRISVARGHSLHLDIEFADRVERSQINEQLSRPYLTYLEDPLSLTPNKTMARRQPMQVYWGCAQARSPSRWSFFVIGDNLGRGSSAGMVALASEWLNQARSF